MRQLCSEVRWVLASAGLRKALGAIACDGIGHPSSLTITQHQRGTKVGRDYQSPTIIGRVLSDAGYIVHVFDDAETDAALYEASDKVADKHGFVWAVDAESGIRRPLCASVVLTLAENPVTPVLPTVDDTEGSDGSDDVLDAENDAEKDASVDA